MLLGDHGSDASSSQGWNQCFDVNFAQGHTLRATSQTREPR